jgi:catechol 2,3-dioxygenase-like lactoylglutathione lyase family enzyme
MLDFELVTRNPRRSGGERIFLRNPQRQLIEILVADNAQHLTHFPQHPTERVVGVPHLCFEVPDLDAARATADSLGADVIMQAPADGSFGSSEAGVHRILFVQAPGGTTIELFEFEEKSDLL